MQKTILCMFLGCPLVACVADDALPRDSERAPRVAATQGIAPGPELRELKWTWGGCAAANLAPITLTVDVEVYSPSATYRIKGDATGCDPFDASGETRQCLTYPASPRTLTVSLSELGQTASTDVFDCVDGKYSVPAPAN